MLLLSSHFGHVISAHPASLHYPLHGASLLSTLQDLSFGLVVVTFIIIGLGMFLIPVVPGPAVYLTAGVLVVPLGKSFLAERAGEAGATFDACAALNSSSTTSATAADPHLSYFWASCAFTSVLAFSLKLIAHVMQQKLIGERLSGFVGVRAIVGPNSQQMKAVRYLLSRPGLTIAKASILCGGPDWPTSVRRHPSLSCLGPPRLIWSYLVIPRQTSLRHRKPGLWSHGVTRAS